MKKRYVNGLLVTVPDYITSVNFTKIPMNGSIVTPMEYRGTVLPLSQPYRIIIDKNKNQINIFYREGLLTSDITNNKYITVINNEELVYEGKCNPTETFVVNGLEYIRTTKNLLSYFNGNDTFPSFSNSNNDSITHPNVEVKPTDKQSEDYSRDYAYSKHSNHYSYNANKNTNTDFDIESVSVYLVHYDSDKFITENKFIIYNNTLYIALIDELIKDWTVDDYINYINSTGYVYVIKTPSMLNNINDYLPNAYHKIENTTTADLRKGITNDEPDAIYHNDDRKPEGLITNKTKDNTIDNHYDDIKLKPHDASVYKYGVNSTSEDGYRPIFNTKDTFHIVNIYNHYFDGTESTYNDISIAGLVNEFYVNDAVIIADFIRQLRALFPTIQFYTREEDKDTTKYNEWINYKVTPSDIKSGNYFTSHVWDRPTWGRMWQTSIKFQFEYCSNDLPTLLARRDDYRVGNFLFKYHKYKYIIKDAKGNDFNIQYCILWDRDGLDSDYGKTTSQDEVGYSQFTYKYTGNILYTNLEHAPINLNIVEKVIYSIMFVNTGSVLPKTKNVDDYETQLADTKKVMEEVNWGKKEEPTDDVKVSDQTIDGEYPKGINQDSSDAETIIEETEEDEEQVGLIL